MTALRDLEVLVVDCQATSASPAGHLLEIGWARAGPTPSRAEARLVRLPDGARVPPAVVRITGISDVMAREGRDAGAAWRELATEAARLAQQPAPTVVHYARFETPFLHALAAGATALDVVCTHEIARRVLPDLPRRSLRALAGYFGRAVGVLRRSADHVEATAFVWRELVTLLAAQGIDTWSGLQHWLMAPFRPARHARRRWPMPRDWRLGVPDAPGVYRMLRTSGDVLYVGKATSLHHRVNSYFRKQHGIHERTLEMLSQARGLSFEVTATALEAALLEPDEIKRRRPPYNVALASDDRAVWFATRDLLDRCARASPRWCAGPFSSVETLEAFAALARGDAAALGRDRWAPPRSVFDEALSRLRLAHGELSRDHLAPATRLLRLGARLWREGRRDRRHDEPGEERESERDSAREAAGGTARGRRAWTPEMAQDALETVALRMLVALRRAQWLTRLTDASIVWREPGLGCARLLVLDSGDIVERTSVPADATPPVPPGHDRPGLARRAALTLDRCDRLNVLTAEIKRLVSHGAPVAVRFGPRAPLDGARLSRRLARV